MLLHLAIASVLVFATVLAHTACTVWVVRRLRSPTVQARALRSHVTRTVEIGLLVFLMSAVAVVESGLWAGTYLWVGALPDFESALYFSLVTFTTLGYGDLTLDASWRLLGAFQAANGILMFGWTTALIVAVVQRMVRRTENEPDTH